MREIAPKKEKAAKEKAVCDRAGATNGLARKPELEGSTGPTV